MALSPAPECALPSKPPLVAGAAVLQRLTLVEESYRNVVTIGDENVGW
jgi:hypothetical protein